MQVLVLLKEIIAQI